MNHAKNLKILQEEIKKSGIKAYYISATDPHNSEYVHPHFLAERLAFCPFTGTDGTLLVTQEEAFLFTDGRYFIQAEKELAGSEVKLMKLSTEGYPSPSELINQMDLFPLGMNFMTVSSKFVTGITHDESKLVDIDFSYLIKDKPALPNSPLFRVREEMIDLSLEEKARDVRKVLIQRKDDGHLVASLVDIAYFLELRGYDIPQTPVFSSFLYISLDEIHLFIDKSKLKDIHLLGVEVHDYEDIVDFLETLDGKRVLVDIKTLNYKLFSLLKSIDQEASPLSLLKAIKGPKQIANIKLIHELDGVAMVKFIKFLSENIDKSYTEYQLGQVLKEFRLSNPECYDLSFSTIAGVGENAAEMHYDPTEKTSALVSAKENVLLVDSGGQYHGGTTDITRTFILHEPTNELKHDYTLTLKSMIDLSMAKFIHGCSGRALDMLARKNMWDEGMDYKCGTGHGVGFMLSVHEGPNGFRYNSVPEREDHHFIVPGMVTTVEPGVYKAGKYGIRIENELLCVEDTVNSDGKFYRFETITYCPIETKYLDLVILSDEEISFLNKYHEMVFEKLKNHLDTDHVEFLKKCCEKIVR